MPAMSIEEVKAAGDAWVNTMRRSGADDRELVAGAIFILLALAKHGLRLTLGETVKTLVDSWEIFQ